MYIHTYIHTYMHCTAHSYHDIKYANFNVTNNLNLLSVKT